MRYRVQNTGILAPGKLLTILCKSAILYSEYADTTLLFIFREKKSDAYDYYEVIKSDYYGADAGFSKLQMLKIGEKNLVTRNNDFEMATGNMNGVMGYDSLKTAENYVYFAKV